MKSKGRKSRGPEGHDPTSRILDNVAQGRPLALMHCHGSQYVQLLARSARAEVGTRPLCQLDYQ